MAIDKNALANGIIASMKSFGSYSGLNLNAGNPSWNGGTMTIPIEVSTKTETWEYRKEGIIKHIFRRLPTGTQFMIDALEAKVWIDENYPRDFEFEAGINLIQFSTTNDEAAIAFKLRWL